MRKTIFNCYKIMIISWLEFETSFNEHYMVSLNEVSQFVWSFNHATKGKSIKTYIMITHDINVKYLAWCTTKKQKQPHIY